MRYLLILLVLSAACVAGEPAPITNISGAEAAAAADGKAAAKFTTDAKWETAGYNNDEIVYTILVTSQTITPSVQQFIRKYTMSSFRRFTCFI